MKDDLIPEIINRKSSLCFSSEKITDNEIKILIESAKKYAALESYICLKRQ